MNKKLSAIQEKCSLKTEILVYEYFNFSILYILWVFIFIKCLYFAGFNFDKVLAYKIKQFYA